MSRNILLTIEFDGTDFAGWQVQPDQRTVQGELETILRRMFRHPTLRITGSGRTDAGVHALGMNVSFTIDHEIPPAGLLRGLNSQLPPDIAVLHARDVPDAFCARRWSKGKIYRYRIFQSRIRSTLERKRAWHIHEPLDLDAMREAASHLLGRHDFSCFRASGCTSKHATRDIHKITIYREGPHIHIEVAGSAFVRHMVRNIVGCLAEVGKGLHPPSWMREVLRSRNRSRGASTAPAHGLYLLCVHYNLPPES